MILLLITLSAGAVVNSHAANASDGTLMKVVNPLTGDQWFNFTTLGKSEGDTFIINITVVNVTDLTSWQFVLHWDSSLLTFVSGTIPSDSIFGSKTIVAPPPYVPAQGQVICGAALLDPRQGVTGSGRLAQVELRIVNGVGQSPLSFAEIVSDTFLLDGGGVDISFTAVNGYYEYSARVGDVNNDGIVNIRDVSEAILAFNSFAGASRWNSYADVDYSGRVDMRDIVLIVLNIR